MTAVKTERKMVTVRDSGEDRERDREEDNHRQ